MTKYRNFNVAGEERHGAARLVRHDAIRLPWEWNGMAGMENRPLSEIFREAADEWVDLDAAARMREETKSLRFAQRCMALGDSMPVNRAEQQIKASTDWHEEVLMDVEARTKANKARVYMESVKMRFQEWQSHEANNRLEARL